MAFLWRHPESRYWVARFYDHTGKRRNRSTKTTDRKQAEKLADEFEQAYRKILTECQARKVLTEIYQEVHGHKLESSNIEDFLATWLKRKAIETRRGSFVRYDGIVKSFLKHLGEKCQKDMAFLTPKDILQYRDIVAMRLSVASSNTHLKVIRMALKDAWKEGLIQENPATKVDCIKKQAEDKHSRRAFTLQEIRQVLAVADKEWYGIILMGIYSGQRLGDIVGLTWNKIDVIKKELRWITQKTQRTVIIPIAPPLLNYLSTVTCNDIPNAPLFPRAFHIAKKELRVSTLSRQFADLLAQAGLIVARKHTATGQGRAQHRQTMPLSFHCLRHTATSLLKNAGVSEAVAMDIIGHESKAISLNYTHIEEDTKRKALELLPDITRINHL